MSTNTNVSKKTVNNANALKKKIDSLETKIEKLTEESEKQRKFILYLHEVIFGLNSRSNAMNKLNKNHFWHENTTFPSLIDEVQALSTAMAHIVYDNPQNYYNNHRGDRRNYMSKIKNRGETMKINKTLKNSGSNK